MGNKSSSVLQDREISEISETSGFSAAQIERLCSRFSQLDRSNSGTLARSDLMSIQDIAANPLSGRLIEVFFSDIEGNTTERIDLKHFISVLATFRPTPGFAYRASELLGLNPETVNLDAPGGVVVATAAEPPPQPFQVSQRAITRRLTFSGWNTGPAGDHQADSATTNGNLIDKLKFVFRIYDLDNDGKISYDDLTGLIKLMADKFMDASQLRRVALRALAEIDEDCDGFVSFVEFCKLFNGKDLDERLRVKFVM